MKINSTMHISIFRSLTALVALTMLSGTPICMGLSQGHLKRDLKLAAEAGIDPDVMLRGRGNNMHAMVHATEAADITPQYVEVGNLSFFDS